MRLPLLVLLVPAVMIQSQEPAPAPTQAAPAATSELTAAQTASPELVGELVKQTGVTPGQAQSAAGTLFGVAKGKLSAADFAKVAAAVPNMDGLLKAAPAPAAAKSGSQDTASKALAALGGASTAVSTANALSKLGLKPDQIVKITPALVKIMQSKGGAEVGTLLAGALK